MRYCARCGAPVTGAFCAQCGASTGGADGDATRETPTEDFYGRRQPPAWSTEPTGQQELPPHRDTSSGWSEADYGPDQHQGSGWYADDYRAAPGPTRPTRSQGHGMRNGLVAAIVSFSVLIGAGIVYLTHRNADASKAGSTDAARSVAPGPQNPSTGTEQDSTTSRSTQNSRPTSDPTSAQPSTTATTPPTPGAPSPTPTSDGDAKDKLNAWSAADADRSTPDGRWQVVLDSKYPGIEDHVQQQEPFTASQIWSRFQGYRSKFPDDADRLRVLRSTDYGKQSPDHTYWVVMLLEDLGSKSEAQAWCSDHFTQTGTDLENVCIPAKFTQPHQ